MGIFDKKPRKKSDDFDSPVEQIDLSASGANMVAATDGDDDEPAVVTASVRSSPSPTNPPATASSAAAEPARPAAPRRAPASAYGIDDAIALMRTLPSENVELVVQVVKHTLESTRIDISTIIEDASGKQSRIESRIKVLRSEIAELEHEIMVRRKEIDGLDTDYKETTMVKERLALAEKLTARDKPADAGAAGKGDNWSRAARPTGEVPRTKPPTAPPPASGSLTSNGATPAIGSPTTSASSAPSGQLASAPSGPAMSAPGPSTSPAGATKPVSHTVIKK